MTRLLRVLLAPLLVVVTVPLLLATAAPASACSCAPPADPKVWGDEVFVATMTEGTPDDAEGETAVEAVVTHVYRGDVGERVRVLTYAGETSCGDGALEAGEALLFSVLAADLDDGTVVVSPCGGSPQVRDDVISEVEAALGPGVERAVPPGASVAPDDGGGLGATGSALLALGAGLGVVSLLLGAGAVVRSRQSRVPR